MERYAWTENGIVFCVLRWPKLTDLNYGSYACLCPASCPQPCGVEDDCWLMNMGDNISGVLHHASGTKLMNRLPRLVYLVNVVSNS
jgi:hypothetical protein